MGVLLAMLVVPAGSAAADRDSPEPATPTDKIVERFMALDIDASNAVSFEEYMIMVRERAEARFAAMDGNGDGEVTAEEYRAFWKARRAKWYRIKH